MSFSEIRCRFGGSHWQWELGRPCNAKLRFTCNAAICTLQLLGALEPTSTVAKGRSFAKIQHLYCQSLFREFSGFFSEDHYQYRFLPVLRPRCVSTGSGGKKRFSLQRFEALRKRLGQPSRGQSGGRAGVKRDKGSGILRKCADHSILPTVDLVV